MYRWLVKKNKLHKAHKILLRIYGNEDDASSCMSDITASLKESHIQKPVWKACLSLNFLQRWLIERNAGLAFLVTHTIFLYRLLLGFCLLFFPRISGMPLAL